MSETPRLSRLKLPVLVLLLLAAPALLWEDLIAGFGGNVIDSTLKVLRYSLSTALWLALAWLVSELMDRVLWRGLLTDKYAFFEQLGKAANKVLEVRPRASERTLMGAMWCAAADIVSYCGWERGEE